MEEHEIASSSLKRSNLPGLSDKVVFRELIGSKNSLENVIDEKVNGFSAPIFKRPDVVFDALRDAGYAYDSSMVPSLRIPGWYGGDDCGSEPFELDNGLTEAPISVNPWHRLPISGFWSRLLGSRQALAAIYRLVEEGVTPVLYFYFHPYEFADLSGIPGTPLRRRLRSGGYALSLVEDTLERHESRSVASLAQEADQSGTTE